MTSANIAIARLRDALDDASRRAHIDLSVSQSIGDGFGLTDADVVVVSRAGSTSRVSLWHERGNDFWIQFSDDTPDAAWWSRGDDLDILASVVVAILNGSVTVDGWRVVVVVDGSTSITLPDRL